MFAKPHCPIIAIEEHYWDPELASHFTGSEAGRGDKIQKRLEDFAGERIRDMDEAGIDIQVLSHGAPAGQKLDPEIAIPLMKRVNDRLAAVIADKPDRFAGFASLPTNAPEAAADELERCVGLGFKGGIINGLSNGEFLDLPKYWPIFARAEKLDVPLYLHPAVPHDAVRGAYFQDYEKQFPSFARPAWGYTIENGTQAIRLVLSGIFEHHPNLKIIVGHFGETLPFLVWRIDQALSRPGQKSLSFRDIFCRNFWVTTSGFFSNPALVCSVMEMGVDRILFAVDWPFVSDSKPAVDWMGGVPLCDEDKVKILSGNAKRLLKM
jgi:2,3-dihydroxybenzoate decarboxylase